MQWRSGRALLVSLFFFFSSRRRHTRFDCDWSSDVCSSDLAAAMLATTFVSVAAVPYLPDGHPDLDALTAQPIADASIAAAWEVLVRGIAGRSEERRVGKEGRERGGAYDVKTGGREVEWTRS